VTTQVSNMSFDYALGYTAAEHERLIRQAALIALTPSGYFAKRASVQGSGFSTLALESATSPCC
jgi:hypothetical protein